MEIPGCGIRCVEAGDPLFLALNSGSDVADICFQRRALRPADLQILGGAGDGPILHLQGVEGDLDALRKDLERASSLFVTGFEKIKVSQDFELRKVVRGAGGSYKVVKNTIAGKAAE